MTANDLDTLASFLEAFIWVAPRSMDIIRQMVHDGVATAAELVDAAEKLAAATGREPFTIAEDLEVT